MTAERTVVLVTYFTKAGSGAPGAACPREGSMAQELRVERVTGSLASTLIRTPYRGCRRRPPELDVAIVPIG